MPPKKPKAKLADLEAAGPADELEVAPVDDREEARKAANRERMVQVRAQKRLSQAQALKLTVERLEAMHTGLADIARALPASARAAAEPAPAKPTRDYDAEIAALRTEFSEKLTAEKRKRKTLKNATRYLASRVGITGDSDDEESASGTACSRGKARVQSPVPEPEKLRSPAQSPVQSPRGKVVMLPPHLRGN